MADILQFSKAKARSAPTAGDVKVPANELLELMLESAAHPLKPGARFNALSCYYVLSTQLEGFNADVCPELKDIIDKRSTTAVAELEFELEGEPGGDT